jgi:hypothetical protein
MYKKSKDIAHIYTNKIIENSVIIIYTFINGKNDPPPGVLQDGPTPFTQPPD